MGLSAWPFNVFIRHADSCLRNYNALRPLTCMSFSILQMQYNIMRTRVSDVEWSDMRRILLNSLDVKSYGKLEVTLEFCYGL